MQRVFKMNSNKTYENAMKVLEARRRLARPKELPKAPALTREMPDVHGAPTFTGTPSILGMQEWLHKLGYSDRDLGRLNIVHIAGTKGKGSTCAFVRSLLQAHGDRAGFPRTLGLYTSPDMRGIRERIQINDKPISESAFTKYFWEVWDCLSANDFTSGSLDEGPRLPRYLQLIALVGLHTFIRERVDTAIIETHSGGEYDATNVIQTPVVTGITPIGMDHVAKLGPSLENVAWHKAGILKYGAAAFSAAQEPGPAEVLSARAKEKHVELQFVKVDPRLPPDAASLKVAVQRENCSLALAIVEAFLKQQGRDKMTAEDICQGVERFSWPGRFERIFDGDNQWYLDGAHNELSITQAVRWFAESTTEAAKHSKSATSQAERSNDASGERAQVPRIIIFSHYSEERDGEELLKCLCQSSLDNGVQPDHVIFTTYQERLDGVTKIDKQVKTPETPDAEFLDRYSKIWREMDGGAAGVSQERSIEGALRRAEGIGRGEAGGMQTLVTGSLFLVGGALSLLRPL